MFQNALIYLDFLSPCGKAAKSRSPLCALATLRLCVTSAAGEFNAKAQRHKVAKKSRFLKGRKMDWAEEFVRGMIVKGMGSADSFRLIPLTNIPLTLRPGATQRAHLTIIAQKAKIVQAMVAAFFITRNPCKH
jgi:hypothetical protein